jgi:hypothetical protein
MSSEQGVELSSAEELFSAGEARRDIGRRVSRSDGRLAFHSTNPSGKLAVLRQLQRTHGNAAVARALQAGVRVPGPMKVLIFRREAEGNGGYPPESELGKRSKALEHEAEEAAQEVVAGGGGGAASAIQRSVWSRIKGVVGQGIDWIARNIIGPIRNLAVSGWDFIQGAGRRIADAYRQANPTARDWFSPQHLLFRTLTNLRRNLYAEAIEQQRRARAASPARERGTPAEGELPLERVDRVARAFEDAGGKYFEINKEIVEGAVLGDFKDDPTIWNTIGQIAIGFVPYAGQVADVRDLVACGIKLKGGGYKSGWQWFDCALTVIGFIPGLGDAVKAVGRGAKGLIRRAIGGVLKHGGKLWKGAVRVAKSLWRGARHYGGRLLRGALQAGRRLLQGARRLGQRLVNAGRQLAQRVRGMLGRVAQRARSLARSVLDRARGLVGQARGLLGRIVGGITSAARRAFDGVKSLLNRGRDLVGRMMSRGRQILHGIRSRVVDLGRRAVDFLRTSALRAVELGRRLYESARRRASQAIGAAIAQGRRFAMRLYRRASVLIRLGIRGVRRRFNRWIKEPLRRLKERLLNFLRKTYYRITRTRPSSAPHPGHTPGGKRTTVNPREAPENIQALTRENETADALARAGYRVEQNPSVPGPKNPDFLIEGRIFDNVAPTTRNPRNIWSRILDEKVRPGQADRIVINLDDSAVDLEALRRQFRDYPMPGLKEAIVVRGGRVIRLWP